MSFINILTKNDIVMDINFTINSKGNRMKIPFKMPKPENFWSTIKQSMGGFGKTIHQELPGEPGAGTIDSNLEKKKVTKNKLIQLGVKDNKEYKALMKTLSFTLSSRTQLFNALDKLKDHDVVQTILDVVFDDAFKSSSNNEIVSFEYDGDKEDLLNKEIQEEMNSFEKAKEIDKVVSFLVEDFDLKGEYALPVEIEKGKGIVKILDNAELENIVPVYEGTQLQYFLKREGKEILHCGKHTHVHFMMDSRPLKVKVERDFMSSGGEYTLPKTIRVGRSIIYSAINRIKSLQMKEMANTALNLKRIIAPILIMLGIPEQSTPDDIGKIIQQYEKIFEDLTGGIDSLEDLDISDLYQMASKIRVLPNIGNSKGSISTLVLDNDKTGNIEEEENDRRAVSQSTGVPFYYLSLQGTPDMSKLQIIKIYSRYTKKLNSIQMAIKEGLRQLMYMHLRYKGLKVDKNNIIVKMRPITNIENLDNMEYLMSMVSGQQEFLTLITQIVDMIKSSENTLEINPEVYLNIFNKTFADMPEMENLLVLKKKPPIAPVPSHNNQIKSFDQRMAS
jgi:hypothetical protein